MASGEGLRFRTAITEMDDEEIYVRGYPLSDLIRGRAPLAPMNVPEAA